MVGMGLRCGPPAFSTEGNSGLDLSPESRPGHDPMEVHSQTGPTQIRLHNHAVTVLEAAAAKMTSDINSAWSGTYTEKGVTYNVKTSVSVSVVSSEGAGVKSGAQNVIGIALNAPNSGIAPNVQGGPDRRVLNFTDVMNTPIASHEFTHVLGVDDKSGRNLSNSSMVDGGWHTTGKATSQDFRWALGPTLSNSSWSGKGGTKNPDGSRTVGPPFIREPWWK